MDTTAYTYTGTDMDKAFFGNLAQAHSTLYPYVKTLAVHTGALKAQEVEDFKTALGWAFKGATVEIIDGDRLGWVAAKAKGGAFGGPSRLKISEGVSAAYTYAKRTKEAQYLTATMDWDKPADAVASEGFAGFLARKAEEREAAKANKPVVDKAKEVTKQAVADKGTTKSARTAAPSQARLNRRAEAAAGLRKVADLIEKGML